ncbi:carbohydrate kinase [Lachnospiraceae bacterium ZAX-1]
MKKLLAIGEALIDFIPQETGHLVKDVEGFSGKVGGGPVNVCGAYTVLGGQSEMITQLGDDPFGDKIIDELTKYSIGTTYIPRTKQANTCLAFVSLMANGERDFSFYRNPSSDTLLDQEQIKSEWFKDAFALHFSTVCLGEYPMKYAHKRAISYAEDAGLIISFDPNLRFPLWPDLKALKETTLEFLPYAHIVKISDEELEFITGVKTIEEAKDQLFVGNVKLVIFTKGPDGAECYTKKETASTPGIKVKAIDTTGAGDAFIGSFLYQLSKDQMTKDSLDAISAKDMERYLVFSNQYCAHSVQGQGGVPSYATPDQITSK